MLELEEEKRIFIESGRRFLLVEPTASEAQQKEVSGQRGSRNVSSRDCSFVSRLTFSATRRTAIKTTTTSSYEPSLLKVKLFGRPPPQLEPQQSSLAADISGDTRRRRRPGGEFARGMICRRHIDVPRFAMFTFAQASPDSLETSNLDADRYIRLIYRLDDSSKLEQVSFRFSLRLRCMIARQQG